MSVSASPDLVQVEDDDIPAPPEHRLLAAILRRAVYDFVLYREPKSSKHGLAIEAAGWLFWDGEEERDQEGRWTFHYVCSVLELDHGRVRRAVMTLTKADIKRLSNKLKTED